MTQPTECEDIAVLMYHAILAEGDDGQWLDRADRAYALPVQTLHEHLRMIDEARVKGKANKAAASVGGVSVRNEHAPESGQESWRTVITFDDALQTHLTVAAPALAERELPGVFFITSGQLGKAGMMTPEDVRELSDLGFRIGSHGTSHSFLNKLTDEELEEDLKASKAELEDCTGNLVDILSLPGGRGDERVMQMAHEAGYSLVFGSRPGLWNGEAGTEIPRFPIRKNHREKWFSAFMNDPEKTARSMLRVDIFKRTLRHIIGDGAYHLLYRLANRS